MSQALRNGLDALLLVASRRSLGVTEVADELGLDKSTASRILATLHDVNLVEKQQATLRYTLGPAVLRMHEQYHRNISITALARPVMERLAVQIGESVHLGVLANDQAVVVEQVLADSRLVVNADVGGSEPLHGSSVGKCLLAFAPDETRDRGAYVYALGASAAAGRMTAAARARVVPLMLEAARDIHAQL